ncbi:MAG: amidohydrolase [Bacteroidetes bacterium]|nr:MAG: amidohydrolase [Bacteroidota bacterium]
MKINAHGHLLPDPSEIPDFMRRKKVFWVDEDRRFMRQGDWKRPITGTGFFLDEKLEWMDQNGIRHEVILNLSQLYCNGMERSLAADVIRFQNEFNAGVQSRYPDRITAGFVVQPAFTEDALEEIDRAVNHLKMRVLCLPTHFMTVGKKWVSIAHPSVEPLFERANEYGLAVEIHPYDGPKMIGLEDRFWRFHLVWMCAQTADAYHFFTLQNYPEKYPEMRVCFAHGNQFGQVNIGRRVQGYEGRPDLFEGAADPRASLARSNLFFDTLVHDPYSLRLIKDRQGSAQIVAGLDNPYPLGEVESVPGSYPGKVLDDAVALGFISEEERARIWFDNVLRWLGSAWPPGGQEHG